MTKLYPWAFALGLAILGWIAAGFAGTSWLALVVTAIIAAVYVLGFLELRQFRGATAALRDALERTTAPPGSLADWLQGVPPALRHAVRLRVEGERAGLPAPALSPYLVGLLVMLGMLGTFLGMIVTFKGAVFALEGSTDLQAIRAALAEPVKGLGLSFGTSVAGVASSALLGLLLAIARRERMEVGRELDQRVAGVLAPFSLAHRRQASFDALQAQARALPDVVGRLDALLQRMEERSQHLDDQLLQRHRELQREVTGAFAELAQRVGTALAENMAGSGQATADAVRPVVEATLARAAADAQRLHERLGELAQAQLEGLSARFEASSQTVAATWTAALEQHARTGAAAAEKLHAQLDAFSLGFEQRSADLVAAVHDTVARGQERQAEAERERLQAWSDTLHALGGELQAQWRQLGAEAGAQQQAAAQALDRAAAEIATQAGAQASLAMEQTGALLRQSEDLVRARAESESRWVEEQGRRMDQLAALWRSELQALRAEERERGEAAIQRLEQLRQDEAQRGDAAIARLEALRQDEAQRGDAAVQRLEGLRQDAAERGELALQRLEAMRQDEHQRMEALLERLEALRQDEARRGDAAIERLEALREDERERGAAAVARLEALRQDEHQRGDAAVARLGELQAAVAQHLATLGAALEAPLTRLLQTASEVPQAAAGVIAQLRQEMGRLAERDNLALQERTELMERLRALLDAVGQGTQEQRAASEALVASASSVLQEAGARYAAALDAQAGQAADNAARLAAGAIEVASLAEAFGQGIERFQAGNDKLVEALERMEVSLRRSTTRSDEQLAYYVAQAREVIDLSIASQQDLVESLRQLRGKAGDGQPALAGAEGARA